MHELLDRLLSITEFCARQTSDNHKTKMPMKKESTGKEEFIRVGTTLYKLAVSYTHLTLPTKLEV